MRLAPADEEKEENQKEKKNNKRRTVSYARRGVWTQVAGSENKIKIVSENHYKRFPRKIDDWEGPNVKIPIHRYILNNFDANKSHGFPGWSRGAKMASQDAPEVPKWLPKVLPKYQNRFPRCSRDAKMESQNTKKKAPSSPNGNWTEKKTWHVEMGARLPTRC